MLFRFILLLVIFAVLIVWIDFLNPGTVRVALPGDLTVEPSKIAVMLGSAAFGAVVVLFGFYLRATGQFLVNWKTTRSRQKEARVQALYSKGLNAILSRRYDVAADMFQKVLAVKPAHADSLLRLGGIHYRDGNHAEAARLHQRARDIDPDNLEVLFALALDYECLRRTEDALQVLEDILAKDEGNLRALGKMRDIYQKQGDFESAVQTQERVLKFSMPAKDREEEQRRLVGLKYESGRVLLEEGNLEKAKRVFKALVKSEKDFVPAHMGLGEVLNEEGDASAAAALWEEAYKETGSIVLLHRLEDLYLKLGNPGRIINLFKEALLKNPRDVNLNFFLGKLYCRLEMVDDAYETLSAIDASSRKLPDLHKLLANLLARRGEPAKAVEEFNKALAFSDRLIVPYRCDNCEHFSTEWSGRCPRCGKWNTYGVDLDAYC